MENLDVSPQFKASSPSVASPCGSRIACLSSTRLQIRCLTTFDIIRSIALPPAHDLRTSRIAWSPPTPSIYGTVTPPRRTPPARSNRILVADDETTRVYDLRNEKWSAVISNGSGGMGKNVHAEFGRTENEALVWSDFASVVKVWCLKTGRTVEIRDPKFIGRESRGWGYRPFEDSEEGRGTEGKGTVMAILCRSAGQDILLLLAPKTYKTLSRIELPTVDAQGLRWSRDGRWLAIWDAASCGYRLCIYTADGHLYRTITREASEMTNDWDVEGLGIKSIEWVPGNAWLAVGGWDRRVRILSTRTFAPVVFLDHTADINVPSAPVYTEHVEGRGERSYMITQQPATPPKAQAEKNDIGIMKCGIGILAFNTDGTLCATRDDATPSTVWIWDLRCLRPRTILIQHSPVKSLSWHPTNGTHLLIQTAHDSPVPYIYSTAPPSGSPSPSPAENMEPLPPTILDFGSKITRPTLSLGPKWNFSWLHTAADKKPILSVSHQQAYMLAWPEGKDQILRFEHEDGEESDDSLYDILTGRTPVPRLHDSRGLDDSGEFDPSGLGSMGDAGYAAYESIGYDVSGGFEDTFREKRRTVGSGIPAGRGESVFYESGLDEMF
ncbi:WD40 repeat-like protein [Corynespora cassiicola Philippines]|uniref:WD40 repeat-like protein n=1 Tax=Corynespora cassiicola Philippines TaxID=1448308 RepID=A0A2T2P956_CORCC|nr:WD40 repeat-like protein [Corynespora cassiicola Philippines]